MLSEEICNKIEEKDKYEKLRLWSALSFAVMLIPIGIPLWWKTTEVYRAPLPFDRINRLDTRQLKIAYTILVYTEYPSRTNSVIRHLNSRFSSLGLYDVAVRPRKIDSEVGVSLESVEADRAVHPDGGCTLLLVQVDSLPDNLHVLVSNSRIIYFTLETALDTVGDVISDWFLRSGDLEEQILSIVDPDEMKERARTEDALLLKTLSAAGGGADGVRSLRRSKKLRRLRASPTSAYDVIFTVVNSDPENVHLVWDVESAIKAYFDPLLEQIAAVGRHVGKSQWLHLVDLAEHTRRHPSKPMTVIPHSQLAHIITPLEKKLGSGVVKNACVHMIAYFAGCDVAPLWLMAADGEPANGAISPEWGAIQIVNPDRRLHCTTTTTTVAGDADAAVNATRRTPFVPQSHRLMAVFVTQFHSLLGVSIKDKIDGVEAMESSDGGSLLRQWQLDALYTMRTVEQITLATLSLQSLSKLLGEISNIVINEEVAACVGGAVDGVELAVERLGAGDLRRALAHSTDAFLKAETAFTNPSLLALLYFPDDQKYAVYIPLFLPIMIPVLMSLKKIYNWILQSTGVDAKTKTE